MSYVRKTLGSDEEILFSAKFHWTYTLTALLWLVVLGIIVVGRLDVRADDGPKVDDRNCRYQQTIRL